MRIFKEIFKFVLKGVVGIFAFYLFCSWVVIPLALPWAIETQGKEILKTPVHLRGAMFNPFLLRVTLKGLDITDKDKNTLIDFDRFSVDVSFLNLLKKVYRVESVQLDGLKVNASLIAEGRIDLLDLVPQTTQPEVPVNKAADTAKAPEPLPVILVDEIILSKGEITFTDKTLTTPFKASLNNMNLLIKGFAMDPEAMTTVDFKAKLDEKGVIDAQAQLKAFHQPLEMDLTFGFNDYALTVLSPYVGKFTGRELGDGKMDFKIAYRISDNQLVASHKVLIQHFEFGKKVESKDALNLPFGLAVALLEDPQGRINISLPAKGDMSKPEFKYTQLIWQVVNNFFVKLITKPFSILASVIGSDSGTDELGIVKFLPGKDDLSIEEKEKVLLLAKGLKERPKVLLQINGSYDPQVDWKAIKIDALEKDYVVLKGESTKTEDWVYQTLFQRRFGVVDLWKLTKSYKFKDGKLNSEAMNAEIKRRLIEDASPDKIALEFLAQSRAKLLYDELVSAGLPESRVSIGNPREAQSSMGFVPLEFTLTVFEK